MKLVLKILLPMLLVAVKAGAVEPVREFHPEITSVRDSVALFTLPDSSFLSAAIEIRASVTKPSEKATIRSNGFAAVMNGSDGSSIEAWLIPTADDYDPISRKRQATFTLILRRPGVSDSVLVSKTISGYVAPADGFNTLGMEMDSGSNLTVYAGDKKPEDIATVHDVRLRPLAVGMKSRGTTAVELIVTETVPDPAAALSTGKTPPEIAGIFNRRQPEGPEGIWHFLDRDTDNRSIRLGGEYTIAIVADEESAPGNNAPKSYTIIYFDGAKVENGSWKPGMKKGRLTATSFQNHYNLSWITADMQYLDTECNARLSNDKSIISFNFPIYGSTVRFSRQAASGALPTK